MNEKIASLLPALVEVRRDLHKYPEVGFTEWRTASLVADRLDKLGYQVQVGEQVMDRASMMGVPAPGVLRERLEQALKNGATKRWVEQMPHGMTGVVGIIKRGKGPTVALRFDMDAIEVAESESQSHIPSREGFASRCAGLMHACGHDGHTAIGLALAELLAAPDLVWNGTLKLIFQPAEEGCRGALPMVNAGVVDDVDYFLTMHLGCGCPTGTVAATATDFLVSTKYDAFFTGNASHPAANPQDGRNSLLAAAFAAIALHAIPRHGEGATFINVGHLEAGGVRNVVPASSMLKMELRATSESVATYLEERARIAMQAAADMHSVELDLVEAGKALDGRSDKMLVDVIAEAAREAPHVDRILLSHPLGGCEDATHFMRRVQDRGGKAVYCLIGSNLSEGHHHPLFDFDEQSLLVAVGVLLRAFLRLTGS